MVSVLFYGSRLNDSIYILQIPSRFFFLFLALLGWQLVASDAIAQPVLGYVSAEENIQFEQHIKQTTKDALHAYEGFYKSKLKALYERRDERLLTNYLEGKYLLDAYWQGWIDDLLRRIIDANPSLKNQELRAFVGRGSSVNARCYGNGVVVLDLGLLVRLHNEDQVTFVLCHELAHQALNHVNTRYMDRTDRMYSKETQKKLRQLRRATYAGAYDDFLELNRNLVFDFSRHSRYGEFEADSLGLEFYRKMDLSPEGPIGLMQVLAKADSSQFGRPLDLRRMLSTPDYPAKDRWFRQQVDDFLLKTDTLTALERDSLRTHPDTDLRLSYMSDVMRKSLPVYTELDEINYAARRKLAEYALTAGAFDASRLDLSLYHSLRGIEAYPHDAWYKGTAALSLAFLAEARLSTTFSGVCPMPKRHHQEYRKALMEALHNMRSSDLKNLSYHYAKAIPEAQQTPESMLALVVALELDGERTREAKAARLSFRKAYPKHPYQAWLVNK